MATTLAGTGVIEWRCMGRQVRPARPVIWGEPIVHLSVRFVSLAIRITFFAAASGNAAAVCGTIPAETQARWRANDGKLVGTRYYDVQSLRAMNIAGPTGPPIVDRYRYRSRSMSTMRSSPPCAWRFPTASG